MNKAYKRIDWQNEPSTSSPINETNLNKMDKAIDDIDNRVITLDTSVSGKQDAGGIADNLQINYDLVSINDDIPGESGTAKIPSVFSKVMTKLKAVYNYLDSRITTATSGMIKSGDNVDNNIISKYTDNVSTDNFEKITPSPNYTDVKLSELSTYISSGFGKVKKVIVNINQTLGELETKVDDGFDDVNSNLDTLAYGENCGGKNIWKYDNYFKDYCGYAQNGNEFYGATSDILKMPDIYLADNNSQYTISFDGKHETAGNSGISAVVDYTDGTQDYVPVTSDVVSYKKFTLTTNPNKTISLIRFSYGSYKAGTSYIKNFQIEKGSSATDYEPYIMSNRQLTQQNDSLDEQKLLPEKSVAMRNGFYGSSNGVYAASDIAICDSDYCECNVGDLVHVKYSGTLSRSGNPTVIICFYNSSKTFISCVTSTTNEAQGIAPANAKYYTKSFLSNSPTINISNMQKSYVYINNAIDEIKADLAFNNDYFKTNISLLELFKSTPLRKTKTFIFDASSYITDYPTALSNAGATYIPIVEITKADTRGYITITAALNAGTPKTIKGYTIGTSLFWGSVI